MMVNIETQNNCLQNVMFGGKICTLHISFLTTSKSVQYEDNCHVRQYSETILCFHVKQKKFFASIFTHESNILLPLQKMRRECALRMVPGKLGRITHSANRYPLITMM